MYYLPVLQEGPRVPGHQGDGADAEDQLDAAGKGRLAAGDSPLAAVRARIAHCVDPARFRQSTGDNAYFQRKIRHTTAADDAHPGRRHLSAHDDAVRGGPRIERARAGRGAGRRQEDLSGHAARRLASTSRGPTRSYQVGTIANIVQSLKLPDGNIKVLVEGVERGKVVSRQRRRRLLPRHRADVQLSRSRPGPQLEALIGARHRRCSSSTSSSART